MSEASTITILVGVLGSVSALSGVYFEHHFSSKTAARSRQADIARELYKRISRTDKAFDRLTYMIKSKNIPSTWFDKAGEELNSMIDYYEDNKILLGDKTIQKIDGLIRSYRDSEIFIIFKDIDLNEGTKSQKEIIKEWTELRKKIPSIQDELKKDFQRILGVRNKR